MQVNINIRRNENDTSGAYVTTILSEIGKLESDLKVATSIAATRDITVILPEYSKGFALTECRNFSDVCKKIKYLIGYEVESMITPARETFGSSSS
jgi:hypothetical protein